MCNRVGRKPGSFHANEQQQRQKVEALPFGPANTLNALND